MPRASTVSIRLAWLFLAAVMVFSAWKAWAVPLTPDEARTYNDFVSQDLHEILGNYDANHHLLHTYLCAISVWLFGVSEFTLRLPALFAGAGCLVVGYLLSRKLFGTGLFFLPSVALLSINPLILDHLSLARGYGFALWFLLLAFYWMLQTDGKYFRIGIALGLCVASNLSFLFPAAALLSVFMLAERRRGWELIESLLLPGLIAGFLLMVLPLSKAAPGDYYYGAQNFREAVESLIDQSFNRSVHITEVLNFVFAKAARWMGLAVLILLFPAWVATVIRWRRERWQFIALPDADRFLYLAGGCGFLTLAGLALAHARFGLAYPMARTGLYFIPLLTLAALVLIQRYAPWRLAVVPAVVVAVLFVAQYASQLDPNAYWEWKGSSGLARVAARIRSLQPPDQKILIKTSNAIDQVLNYYRTLYKWKSWSLVERHPENGGADFCVLEQEDAAMVKQLNLKVLYVDKASGLILAR